MADSILGQFSRELDKSIALLGQIREDRALQAVIKACAEAIYTCLTNGNKVIFAGNGGSAADSQHLAGELVSKLNFDRPGLASIALTVDTSVLTAIGNDYGYDKLFRRQLEALAKPGDIFVGISTSGNSSNVLEALDYCRDNGIISIGFTGNRKGKMNDLSTLLLEVPHSETPKIQECHIMIGHFICGVVEEMIFKN